MSATPKIPPPAKPAKPTRPPTKPPKKSIFTLPEPSGPPRFVEGEDRLVGRVEPPAPSHAGHLPIGVSAP